MINQQAQDLPALLDLKGQREHQNRMFGLQEEELATSTAHAGEMLDIQKENQKLAERLGYANIGLTTAFEFAKYGARPTSDAPGILESVGTGAKKFGSKVAETFSDVYDWAGETLFDW